MYLAILLIAILYLYTIRHSGKDLLEYGVVSALVVLFPLTNMLILLVFQNFYGYEESMWLLPMLIVPSYAVTELYDTVPEGPRKKFLIPVVCIIVFLCGWMSFDKAGADYFSKINDAADYDKEYIEVYDLILDDSDSNPIIMVGPREIMEHARLYSGRIGLAYGRDIWEVNLDYAFYEPNTEHAYDLSKKVEEEIGRFTDTFVTDLIELNVNYVVLNKDNLSYGDDMQYPAKFKKGNKAYFRMEETRHYVIYKYGK